MKNTKFPVVLAVVFSAMCMLTSDTGATLVTTDADTADAYVGGDGITASGKWHGDASVQVSGTNSREYILVFQLPSLGGESIQTADISASVEAPVWQSWGNIDLYGVRSHATASTVALSDYGVFGDSASGTKIQDSFFASGTGASNSTITVYQSLSTNASGDAALATWLSNQYSAVGEGGYVFLRFQPDSTGAIGNNAVTFASAENSAEAIPRLSITTVSAVPEPGSFLLVGLGMLVMRGLRKSSV